MAEPAGRTLSESDVEKLRQLFVDFYGKPQSTTQRPYVPSDDEYLTPEVYVAFTPSGGIPALSEGGDSGTALGPGDTPGSADCQVYQLVSGALQVVTGLTRKVYNFGGAAVAGSEWVLVLRDKYGTWWTDGSSSVPACVSFVITRCVAGSATDYTVTICVNPLTVSSVSVSPPPPPAVPAYYCVSNGSGGKQCVYYATTAPASFFSGPYTTSVLCAAGC